MEFPAIFTIRVNRVIFDLKTMQTVKCNDYLKYPKTINLERYSSEKEDVLDRKTHMIEDLDRELNELKEQLVVLTEKNEYPDTPLNMLRSVATLLSSQQIASTTLYQSIQSTLLEISQKQKGVLSLT
jgi:hypothetical protein